MTRTARIAVISRSHISCHSHSGVFLLPLLQRFADHPSELFGHICCGASDRLDPASLLINNDKRYWFDAASAAGTSAQTFTGGFIGLSGAAACAESKTNTNQRDESVFFDSNRLADHGLRIQDPFNLAQGCLQKLGYVFH